MRHRLILSVVLLCCAVPALVFGQTIDSAGPSRARRPDFSDYVIESAGGLGCGCGVSLAPMVGAIALFESGPEGAAIAVGCVGLGAYAVGSAAAANWAGNRLGWSGSFGRSVGLAAIPAACGGLFLWFRLSNIAGMLGGMAAVFGTPVMAAVGYNIGATRREPQSWEDRLAPPSFTARALDSPEPGERRDVAFEARLLTVRF